MLHQTLNGNWKMREETEGSWMDATVPGSVMSAMLENHQIGDPFWRLNEYEARELFRKDYEFRREFHVSQEFSVQERIELLCYGLDTLAEIYVNDSLLAKTNNMHRTWRFECKALIKPGSNQIRVVFRAPITFIENYIPEENKEIHFVVGGAMKGNQYLRKAHCMFGWDWGAQVPDAGIWRDMELLGYSDGRIEDVEVSQHHYENKVELTVNTELELLTGEAFTLEYHLTAPDHTVIAHDTAVVFRENEHSIVVDNPKLWWPNGYGEQPLYRLKITLRNQGEECDSRELTLGMRTLTVSQEKDAWGQEFAFRINGVKIFAKGADYIPEDLVYSRIARERTQYLIESCVRANYNCLRVW